jgi:hypothetical protein
VKRSATITEIQDDSNSLKIVGRLDNVMIGERLGLQSSEHVPETLLGGGM